MRAAGGRAREMSRSPIFKLADVAQLEAPRSGGPPSLSMQQLWFTIQRLQWASLVVVPADGSSSAEDFGRPLYEVGKLAMGDRLRLLDARDLKVDRTASLILDMTGANRPHNAGSREWSERVVVMIESVVAVLLLVFGFVGAGLVSMLLSLLVATTAHAFLQKHAAA